MGGADGWSIRVTLALVGASALLLSLVCTAMALRYAHRRGLLDQPGQRRSHTQPTPRGGGVGIVAAMVVVGATAALYLSPAPKFWLAGALGLAPLMVAAAGWRDDHAPLPVWPRLAVHGLAALWLVAAALLPNASQAPTLWWWLAPLVFAVVGSINAHNFMDGIDGILGQQGLFVMLAYSVLAVSVGESGLAALAMASAAGCLGFLFFNLPPAKIFMGDVGSGTLGFAIAAVAVLLAAGAPRLVWACLILPSAFLIDSGLTLLRRVAGGQRWYAAHRQHLYQWLVRVNWSHAKTDAAYMTWNVLVAAPLAWLAVLHPGHGPWWTGATYTAGAAAWLIGKRACLGVARGAHQ